MVTIFGKSMNALTPWIHFCTNQCPDMDYLTWNMLVYSFSPVRLSTTTIEFHHKPASHCFSSIWFDPWVLSSYSYNNVMLTIEKSWARTSWRLWCWCDHIARQSPVLFLVCSIYQGFISLFLSSSFTSSLYRHLLS